MIVKMDPVCGIKLKEMFFACKIGPIVEMPPKLYNAAAGTKIIIANKNIP